MLHLQVVSDSIRSEGVLAPGAGLDGGLSNMISDAMSIRGRGECVKMKHSYISY